jgi:hypothetical protein
MLINYQMQEKGNTLPVGLCSCISLFDQNTVHSHKSFSTGCGETSEKQLYIIELQADMQKKDWCLIFVKMVNRRGCVLERMTVPVGISVGLAPTRPIFLRPL